MRSGPLKYGFVGAGFNAKFHLAALRQLRGIEVAGVTAVGGAPELAAMARGWGLGETVVYDSVYEMAQHVDCVAVCAPNFARVPIVEAVVEAARRGAGLKGVICEKPLGRNVAEARLLVDMAQSVKLRTAYFENQIFMKPIRSQLAQLEPVQRQMGPLSLARSAEEHGGPHEGWFWDPTQQGGGVLCDMGCHSIAVGWHVLTPAGKPLTFLQPQEVNADIALLKWGQPGLAGEAAEGPRRGLREDAGRGLRHRHDHLQEPGDGPEGEGAVHQLVDVREAGAAAVHGRHGAGLRVRDQHAGVAAQHLHRRRGGRGDQGRRAGAREVHRVARPARGAVQRAGPLRLHRRERRRAWTRSSPGATGCCRGATAWRSPGW